MELKKLFFLLILLIAFQNFSAQEKSKAIMIDEFSSINCDEINARISHLFDDLRTDPNSKGYIIIYGSFDKPLEKYLYESEFKANIAFGNFDEKRIVFLHGTDEKTIRIQFWKTPYDAENPSFTEGKWNYKLPQKTKPFLLFKDSWIDEGCHATYDINFYSKLLSANPQLKGNIIDYAKSRKNFYRERKYWLNELVKQRKVSKSQLNFFYVRRKTPDTDFWLIPKRTN
ncbi:MAG: hypothetical protein ACR2GD_06415 [Pyrinomonadaceae bacterium]